MKNCDIAEKRKSLGITIKEFADALGYDQIGEKKLRNWEKGLEEIPQNEYDKIMKFATVTPYKKQLENPEFRFIDLFAGIGGIRIPFQELGGKCVFTSEFDPADSRASRSVRQGFILDFLIPEELFSLKWNVL